MRVTSFHATIIRVCYVQGTGVVTDPSACHTSSSWLSRRPIYGCLLAQRIAAPQMGITAAVTAMHIGICYLLVFQVALALRAPHAETAVEGSV